MNHQIEEFSARLKELYTPEDQLEIIRAARWGAELHKDQKRASGEPYFIHPLQVATILVDLKMDTQTIIAALLHDVLEDTQITRQDIRREFGKDVESLVNGVTKISDIHAKSKTIQEAETIRKMLFAMVKDIRVILIKLADKVHNMRTLEHLSDERRKAIATECLDIFAPLADRLGISWIKDELEDLALKNLNRGAYDQIKAFVSAKKGERADYLERVEKAIIDASRSEGIEIDVSTRAKHFYSIFNKMKRRNKSLEEIFDLLGLRITCSNINECYTILGLVHRLWMPIAGRFKDYIAMPKANRYQSLHTTVMCYGGKLLEIQIRTQDMHRTAEFGIAAHWLYKKGFHKEAINPGELAIVSRLKSWNGIRISSGDFLDEIKRELLKDSIYVFTPQGDVVELPNGSTPIDFAYHIHTEVGNHCFAAKADGAIIPLSRELKNTQMIEIVTTPSARPHVNWLRNVKTNKARSKIRVWLNKNDDSLIIDRNIVAKKKPVPEPEAKDHPRDPGSGKPRDLNAPPVTEIKDPTKIGIRIGNERNMMIRIAKCCTPTTGDDIIGYISRGRGIIVHKRNCTNLGGIKEYQERQIEVEWETVSPKSVYRFKVTAKMTSDLFSEIEGAIRKYHGHLIEGRLEENENGKLNGSFTIELDRHEDYKNVLRSIRTIPTVLNIISLE